MKMKNLFLLSIMVLGLTLTSVAQKIGYVNVDLVLLYMPETKTMEQQLQTYRQKLGEQLQKKQEYYQLKLQEGQQKAANGASEEDLKPLGDELQKLQAEIQEEATKADQQLLKKRQDLLSPITEKLGKAIKDVAAAEGYDYILNTVDGSGVSLVLHGPEGNDLTKTIMTKLGIQIPTAGSGGN